MDSAAASQNRALLISARESLIQKITGLARSHFPDFVMNVETSGIQGLNHVYNSPPVAVIVDSTLPDISGMQICRVLKHDPMIQKLPVVLLVKDNGKEYERLTEMSLIADSLIEEKNLESKFPENLERLLVLFQGLDESERSHIKLLQKEPVPVKAVSRMVELLDQSITKTELMQDFRKLFEMTSNRNVLHHMFFSFLETALDYDIAGLFFNDKTQDPRLMTYHISKNLDVRSCQLAEWTGEIFADLKAKSVEPWLFRNTRHEVVLSEGREGGKPISIKQKLVYPFFIENTLVGALVFFNKKPVRYELIFPFPLIMREMSVLMRIMRYHSEAQMLAISDNLTGLYTHQHFLWCLGREIRQAKRCNSELGLAIISVDNLRQLNATWSPEIGDQVMKAIARSALQNTRSVDLLARAGGRTIIALFSNTGAKQALVPLERIRNNILANPPVWEDKPIPLDISIGIIGFSPEIETAAEFIAKAQKAVDQAREKGHNSIQLSSDE